MKRVIPLLGLLALAGCQNSGIKISQVDDSSIDGYELSQPGIYMINSHEDPYIIFNDFGMDAESVRCEQKGKEILVRFEKETPKEETVVYRLDIDSSKDSTIRCLDENGQEYSFENVILKQE